MNDKVTLLVTVLCTLLTSSALASDPLLEPQTCAVNGGGTVSVSGSQVSTCSPEMRCEFSDGDDQIYLFFVYHGDTSTLSQLGDGSVRRQIGLKVVSQNTCNVLYVMWWTNGTISIQQKINPGMSTHAECRDGGYSTVGTYTGPVLTPSSSVHMLHVRIMRSTSQILVQTDNGSAHVFPLSAEALALTGPVGLRTDNCVADMTTLIAP